MATEQSFVEYVCEQEGTPALACRKMFGEYALYLGDKVVALAYDNSLYLKPTEAGQKLLALVVEASRPYPGAKPHFLIDEALDNPELLQRLLQATAAGLPAPKPKTRTRK